jgi:hypothetical protein
MHILNNPKDLNELAKTIYNYLLTEEEKKYLEEFDNHYLIF